MQSVTSRPAPIDVVPYPRSHPDRSGRGGIELLVTLLAPLAALAALIEFGVSPAVAVCTVFVVTFAVTAAMDIKRVMQTRWRYHERPGR